MKLLSGLRILLFGLLALLSASPALADERILQFKSQIVLATDGSAEIVETIAVRAEGKYIRRGIYRDLPLLHKTPLGIRHRLGFTLIATARNGRPEPHRVDRIRAGVRIYLGEAKENVPPGTHIYTIHYRVTDVVRFFKDYDELYWNVTGFDWTFPIDRASAEVRLPAGGDALDGVSAYVGKKGSTEIGSAMRLSRGAMFTSNRVLNRREGLTVAIPFSKGVVVEPTPAQKRATFFRTNPSVVMAGAWFFAIFGYYLIAWFLFGRDPEGSTVHPVPDAAEELTPAATRYLDNMGFDKTTFSAAILGLAAKGAIRIDKPSKTSYSLSKVADSKTRFSQGEAAVMKALFQSSPKFTVGTSERERIQKAIKALKAALSVQYEKSHFVTNLRWFVPGAILTLVGVVHSFLAAGSETAAAGIFLCVWLTGWSFGTGMLLRQVVECWQLARSGGNPLGMIGAVFLSFFAIPFLGGWVLGASFLTGIAGAPTTMAIVGLLVVNFGFWEWLKRPTLLGKRVIDRIEGLKLFLKGSATIHAPESDLRRFERYLPYAVALGVDSEWSKRFSKALDSATMADGTSHYRPLWYSGSDRFRASSFCSGLSSSLSSAATTSSSSGSSGGGFSGGGSGGGGGGGW